MLLRDTFNNILPLHWLPYGGYAGFYGSNRDALGFMGIAEVGAGFEISLWGSDQDAKRVRLSDGYLFRSDVEGWSVSLGLHH